ncbi:MAG: hypothetical protein KDH96_12470, partial [Candidatus Riesia sp.]|nr:hypothetical protein [Candidatus Riesia sp.]
QINISDPDMANIKVEYGKPELIKSEMEILDIAQKEIDMGVSSKLHYLIEQKGMNKEQALERLKEIEEYESMELIDNGTDDQERQGESNI